MFGVYYPEPRLLFKAENWFIEVVFRIFGLLSFEVIRINSSSNTNTTIKGVGTTGNTSAVRRLFIKGVIIFLFQHGCPAF